MNVTEKLNQWKTQTPNSEVVTTTTITLKTPTLSATVQGATIDDAYAQLESLFKQNQEGNKTSTPFPQNNNPSVQTAPLQPQQAQQNISYPTANTSASSVNPMTGAKLPPEFNGKSILRIYSPGQQLNPGESTVFFNNLTYVVK